MCYPDNGVFGTVVEGDCGHIDNEYQYEESVDVSPDDDDD